MTDEEKAATVKIVAAESESKTPIFEIYRVTLEFLGKLATPLAIVFLVLHFSEEFKESLKDFRVSKIETPFGSIELVEELAAGLASDNPEEKNEAEKKVELVQNLVAAEIEAGVRKEIPTLGKGANQVDDLPRATQYSGWTSVLGVSWVKPNDWLGRTYYLEVEEDIYIWPVEIDADNKKVRFVVNDSASSRRDGELILPAKWVVEGESIEFNHKGKIYRLNLIDIRNAGKIKSKAAFVSVDKKNI